VRRPQPEPGTELREHRHILVAATILPVRLAVSSLRFDPALTTAAVPAGARLLSLLQTPLPAHEG